MPAVAPPPAVPLRCKRTAAVVNPPLGAPPTIEWIAVDRLQVDETYQRSCANAASEQLISRIALGWDWRLFQPLACARRPDGVIVVIDGQHRLLGARRRGDIPHLPCVVGQFANIAEEATAFAAMNRQRKAMSKIDLYFAQAAAGEAPVVEALTVMALAGVRLTRQNDPNRWKPGEVQCIGNIVWTIKRYGPATTRRAIEAITGAYPDQRLVMMATLIRPVAALATSDAVARKLAIVIGRVAGHRWIEIGRERGPDQTMDEHLRARLAKLLAEHDFVLGKGATPAPAIARAPETPKPINGTPVPLPPAPPPKRRKTFEEELEAARNGTATFVERAPMPSRPVTELIGGSSLA